jgi:hypothetical protein
MGYSELTRTTTKSDMLDEESLDRYNKLSCDAICFEYSVGV